MKASLRTLQSSLHAGSHDLDPPVPRRPHRNRVSLIVARAATPLHKPESFLLIHHFYNYDNLADVGVGYAHGGTCFGLSQIDTVERQFSVFETTVGHHPYLTPLSYTSLVSSLPVLVVTLHLRYETAGISYAYPPAPRERWQCMRILPALATGLCG